jgi:hypothetical protein
MKAPTSEVAEGEKVDWAHFPIAVASRVARFLLVHVNKTGKMYQINKKCTKWS